MKTILVVEDEPTIAELLLRVLEEEGYKVVLASDGRQGLSLLAEVQPQPDLVLSDLMMPVLSGTEMYRIMQADPVLSRIPVVLMSAAASPPAPELTAGVTSGSGTSKYVGFLRKPFTMDGLMHLVISAIGPPGIV